MRKVGIIALLVSFCFAGYSQEELSRKEKREANRDTAFIKLVSLVESGEYMFDARRASPQTGQAIDLTTHHAEFDIKNDSASGFLPFFGRAYTSDYGGSGGIEFSNTVENYKVEKDGGKRRIRINFEVQGESDRYTISIDISGSESASVVVISNKRAAINYSGTVDKLKEEK